MSTQPNNGETHRQRPLHEREKASAERASTERKSDPITDMLKGIAEGGPSLTERLNALKGRKAEDVKPEEVMGLFASILSEGIKNRPGRDTDELTPEREERVNKLHKALRHEIGINAIEHGPDKLMSGIFSCALVLLVKDIEKTHPGFTEGFMRSLKFSQSLTKPLDSLIAALASELVGGEDFEVVEIDARNLFRRR